MTREREESKMDVRKKMLIPLATFFIFSLLHAPAMAVKKSYIVYLGGHSHGPEASTEDYKMATDSHCKLLSSFIGSHEDAQSAIFYSYTKYINGFAANLEEEVAQEISRHPGVVSVFENKLAQLHTTRSWEFMQLERDGRVPAASIWTKSRFGEDTIIGNIDSGVWPESQSFNDDGYGPVPSRWKGFCVNNTKEGVPCNRKLIGARYFNNGYKAATKDSSTMYYTTRDVNGHGSHTLSTAGGRFVPGANMFGYGNGTAKGGAPNSRVAAYRVWGEEGIADADTLAAFDAAIDDGVDVLSLSLGRHQTSPDLLTEATAIGSLHAVMHGISVVCSAGNIEFIWGALGNVAPWITTVGASTTDRNLSSIVTLGSKKQIKGVSFAQNLTISKQFYPLINASDAKAANVTAETAEQCTIGSLDPEKVKGKIVVCFLGNGSSIDTSKAVLVAGGAGMILVYDEGDSPIPDYHFLPAINIDHSDGAALATYMKSTKTPTASISRLKDSFGVKPSPVMAPYSCQGPSIPLPQILKPDITAPGNFILAAYTGAQSISDSSYDTRRVPYAFMSGTSMSCPHVAGVTGLLKTRYPDWSPAAIKSAIMTTATSQSNARLPIQLEGKKATPFSYGAGHIRPNHAVDPGLVYDISPNDYLDFLCALGYNSSQLANLKHYGCPSKAIKLANLNYPSITLPAMNGTAIVTRTLKNVGSPGTYKARIKAPNRISVSVKPNVLKFDKVGDKKKFKVSFKSKAGSVQAGYVFGSLVWSDGKHYVRSPLVVKALS